ncbi:MmcQ/YjbR family DNA-binding protein [bacterium]|nr:MmcQ/YjbR family DNA-binding protein [bacterium]
MDYTYLEKYLLNKRGAFLDFPFGPQAAVFKVKKKMFALVAIEAHPLTVSLKCDPDDAIALRSMFDAVTSAYHMNKEHWNTVILDGSIPEGVVEKFIDASYDLVVKGLRKVDRTELNKIP